jgi:threonine synthase
MSDAFSPTPAGQPVEGNDPGAPAGSAGGGASEELLLEEGPILPMLDGAEAPPLALSPEMEVQRLVASDPTAHIELRLEAYQEIIDGEVGDTTLARARNLERETGLRQIYLKFEGGNPTGTQKDRIAFAQCADAMRRGFEAITVATCGNFGVAVALAARLAGLRCVIHIPEAYTSHRVREMSNYGAEILRVPGDYEHAVDVSRAWASEHEVYDANPGGLNSVLQFKKYGQIAFELYDELRDAPFAVAVPVSNGTTLAGVHKGFQSLYRRGKTSRMPRMVAGSSFRKNPVISAFRKSLTRCENLEPGSIKETAINEPLINWRSIDGDEALNAIRATSGWAEGASDKDMLQCARMLREREGLHVLPASTAGLVALLDRHKREPLPGDRYVVVLTGRRP